MTTGNYTFYPFIIIDAPWLRLWILVHPMQDLYYTPSANTVDTSKPSLGHQTCMPEGFLLRAVQTWQMAKKHTDIEVKRRKQWLFNSIYCIPSLLYQFATQIWKLVTYFALALGSLTRREYLSLLLSTQPPKLSITFRPGARLLRSRTRW